MRDNIDNISSFASDIFKKYDFFYIDIWGTLHNGLTLLKRGERLIEHIHKLGKPLALVTNSPERFFCVGELLRQMGLNLRPEDHIISAGEVLYHDLKGNKYGVNTKFYVIDEEANYSYFEGLNFKSTQDIHEADSILVRIVSSDQSAHTIYKKIIRYGYEKNLPLIIANSDLSVLVGKKYHDRPGVLGKYYKEKQHLVTYYGKPFEAIYKYIEKTHNVTSKTKVLCVGDSLYTDVLGANLRGHDSLYITDLHGESSVNRGILDIIAPDLYKNPKPTYEYRFNNDTLVIPTVVHK